MVKYLQTAFLFIICFSGIAQSITDAAIQLTAQVQTSPPQITLAWPGNSNTSQYQVFRKLKTSSTWGPVLATLSGTVNQYADNSISISTNYEYRVLRVASGYTGYGYINTGIEVPAIELRGKLILIVDSTFISSLANEIERLIKDIEGDGWEVIRHDVLRTAAVTHVKSLIVNDYNNDITNTKIVYCLGHVPVPYSGNINPDGHPDHLGAWPADVYYGEMDGLWTDVSVSSTTASPVRTQNLPGDGKFDQSLVPGNIELQVGRVDFANLPAFASLETQLLKNYLDKDHEYRKKLFIPVKRAVIDDNFGYFSGEAFAASGYKNFGPLVGTASITAADYFSSMTAASYLWSYGCGGGSYTSAGGIGTTSNFSTSNLQGVFTMLFGSYFGDWDSQNNFLRAPLAQGKVLTNVWSGRPHYQFHHMAMGENIGYGLLITQNNPGGLYFASPTGITGKWIHNALMGDPTLRNDVVAPVSNVVATKNGNHCNISWTASSESTLIGYHIYMRNDSNHAYQRINSQAIVATNYTDSCLLIKGTYEYMVRALKLETSSSGTYYNLSEGITDTAYNALSLLSIASFTSSLIGATASFTSSNQQGVLYQWDFGDGQSSFASNPSVTYTANGSYTVQLIATHPCFIDTSNQILSVQEVGEFEFQLAREFEIYPNPSTGWITISGDQNLNLELTIWGSEGTRLLARNLNKKSEDIDLSYLSKGIYFIELKAKNKVSRRKLVLN